MTLPSGTKLGPYELGALIGAGGMGEVYRARDLRLERDVAVKVLPTSFATDPDRLRRFEQEARAVAALSHPNILAVHDIGQHDRTPFLVSELLEGESLREVLARGVPSHRKTIDYAVQIAHGLAAAHGRDIAHRDLKPDNIFITREGRVKILDFGLAKNIPPRAGVGESGIGTMTAAAPATEVGTVLGTASYMSPEQVRGAAVDCRTDIFSFGAVLYEMLCGKRAFKRDTTPETMTAILNEDPPELVDSGRQIPPALDRIVRHCLEKAPEQRFQSARDLAFDLESLSTLTSTGSLSAAKVKQRRQWWYVVAIALLAVVAAFSGWKLSSVLRPTQGSQFHQVTFRRGALADARFSPDGLNIIYTAAWEGSEPEIFTVVVKGADGHPLGIKNARLLTVSKSGELVVALAPRQLTNMLAPGNLARTTGSGAPKPEIENVQAADFTPDGSALAIVRYVPTTLKCQVEYPVGKVLHTASAVTNVRFSPDGKYLAFISHTDPTDDRGVVFILRSTGEKVVEGPLHESAQGLAWSPSGDEVWSTSPLETGEIHALALSGKERQPLAVPGRLRVQDIAPDGKLLVEQGIARRGMIVAAGQAAPRDLSWLDFSYLRDISDDGKTILFEEEGSNNYRVFVRDVDGSPAVPIGEGYGISLSHDKKWALSLKLTDPTREIWLLPVGTGEARRINPNNLHPTNAASFMSDDKRVVYVAFEDGHLSRAWIQDLSGGEPRPITPEGTVGWLPSPDDQWLLAGKRIALIGIRDAVLVPMQGGDPIPIPSFKPDEIAMGWTSDGQIYVMPRPQGVAAFVRIEKVNPHTGARTLWRELSMPPVGGVLPDPPIILHDGSVYAYDYRLRLSDLYTVSGVR